jgi:hypothetical protein
MASVAIKRVEQESANVMATMDTLGQGVVVRAETLKTPSHGALQTPPLVGMLNVIALADG